MASEVPSQQCVPPDRSVQFSADGGGFEANATTYSQRKLKGTTGTQGDFNLPNRLTIEVDGAAMVGGIHAIKGFERDIDVIEYQKGEDQVVHTRPGNHKPDKIIITKDWSNTSEFYKWRKAVLDSATARKSMSVIFHNDSGKEAYRIQAEDFYPVELSISESASERNQSERTEVIILDCTTMILKTRTDIQPK